MEIQIAISKVDRYSSPEQGDQVEIVERPNGGVSVILAKASGMASVQNLWRANLCTACSHWS
jgi:hypothetical protein